MGSDGAVFAQAVKSELVRGYFETFVRQLGRFDLFVTVDQHIENAVATLADEVLMTLNQRIEMLRPAEHQHLQPVVGNQLLQIAIYGAQTDARGFLAHPIVNLIGCWVSLIVLNGKPNQLELLGISRWTAPMSHRYPTKSAANEFC